MINYDKNSDALNLLFGNKQDMLHSIKDECINQTIIMRNIYSGEFAGIILLNFAERFALNNMLLEKKLYDHLRKLNRTFDQKYDLTLIIKKIKGQMNYYLKEVKN